MRKIGPSRQPHRKPTVTKSPVQLVGELIRETRAHQEQSLRGLSQASGLTRTTVRRMEGGQGSTLASFLAMVSALGLRLADFEHCLPPRRETP